MEAVVPLSLSGYPAQVERCVPGNDGDVGRRNWRERGEREGGGRNSKTNSVRGGLEVLRRSRCNFTSVQQGGAPVRDGRSVSSGGASAHFEDVVAVGVQKVQLNVGHTGITDELHLQQAVSALHLYSPNTEQPGK